MSNPIKSLTKKEWILWIGSLAIVILSNLLSTDIDVLTLVSACVGITSLIFAAKGNVWAQILMVVFSILYGQRLPGLRIRLKVDRRWQSRSLPESMWQESQQQESL